MQMQAGWSRDTVAGKKVDWFDPPAKPRFALLYLHPVGQESLADNARFTELLTQFQLGCCAPHGAESWWADRVCETFDPTLSTAQHIIGNVQPAMRERWTLPTKAIAIAGISMGGQGALRLAFQQPDTFNVVAGIASALDYYEWYGRGTPLDACYKSREACRQDTALLHIQPDRYPKHIWFACDPHDEWFRGNDRLDEKLRAMGIPHTTDLTSEAGGHSWPYFEAMAAPMLGFIVKSLEVQARRLL
jgi:esterase/lipase superfamily enzyme